MFGWLGPHQRLRSALAEGRAVLESVPGAAAHEPDVIRVRVPVEDEASVRRVLILADAALEQRRAAHAGETFLHMRARVFEALSDHAAIAMSGLERRPTGIIGELEAAPAIRVISRGGDAVVELLAMVDPDRELFA